MLNYTTKLILFLGLIASIGRVSAQAHVTELSDLYQQAISQLDSLCHSKPKNHDEIQKLFTPDTFRFADYRSEILHEELKVDQNDYGLNFLSSYTRNFGEGFNNETENFTRDRFVLELQWNLLSEGYRDSKIKNEVAANELVIHEMERMQYLKQREYGLQYNAIIYLFNRVKLSFLKPRLDQLESQEQIFNDLYLNHLLPYTHVLAVRKKVSKYRLFIKDAEAFNESFETASSWKPGGDATRFPVYGVAIAQLLEAGDLTNESQKLLEYQNQNVYLRDQLQKDIKLRLFARRTYTVGALDGFNRNFNSLGVAVNMPLRNFRNSREKLLDLQVQQNIKEYDYESYHLKKELLNHYYEYEYKLHQYQQMAFDARKLDEIIRKDQLKSKDSTFHVSKINSLELLNERADVELELITLKQQLYLKLLKIHSLAGVNDMTSYLIPDEEIKEEKLVGDRIAVIKISDIQSYSFDLITAYLKNSEINKVQADSLSETTIRKIRSEGIEITNSFGEVLPVDPSEFARKSEMEQFIRQQISEEIKTVLIVDLSALIELELKTIKNQQQ